MAWTAPRTWVTGEIVTSALLNTHVRDNLRYLKGTDGGVSLDDVNGSYLELPNMTTANLPGSPTVGMEAYDTTMTAQKDYVGAAGGLWTPRVQLLFQANGNNTATGATTLTTIAMASSLKAGDKLLVHASYDQATQPAASIQLRNTTDSVVLDTGGFTALGAGGSGGGLYIVSRSPVGATIVITQALSHGNGSAFHTVTRATFTTAWEAAWTLGLYETSQTSGGTTYWHWQVWRLPAL